MTKSIYKRKRLIWSLLPVFVNVPLTITAKNMTAARQAGKQAGTQEVEAVAERLQPQAEGRKFKETPKHTSLLTAQNPPPVTHLFSNKGISSNPSQTISPTKDQKCKYETLVLPWGKGGWVVSHTYHLSNRESLCVKNRKLGAFRKMDTDTTIDCDL